MTGSRWLESRVVTLEGDKRNVVRKSLSREEGGRSVRLYIERGALGWTNRRCEKV